MHLRVAAAAGSSILPAVHAGRDDTVLLQISKHCNKRVVTQPYLLLLWHIMDGVTSPSTHAMLGWLLTACTSSGQLCCSSMACFVQHLAFLSVAACYFL